MKTGTILQADRLIPGDGGAVVEQPAIIIEHGRIRTITTQAEAEALRQGHHVVSLPGSTLLPGLIDCHVHLNLPADGSPVLDIEEQSDTTLSALSMNNAHIALEAGVTSLRDCGGRRKINVDLRNAIENYGMAAPGLVVCGPPITITGGHCWFFGGEAEGVAGVRRKVRELIKQDVNFIKVMAAGGGTPNTLSWQPAFSQEELNAIVEEAHLHDLKASAHCLNREATLRAVRAGFDQIEHAGFLLDRHGNQQYEPEVAEALIEAQVVVCPTLAVGLYVLKYLEEREELSTEEVHQLERWRGMLTQNVAHLAQMLGDGLRVVAGTDAGWRWTPFDALVNELELMAEAGMSNAAVIEAATSKAAAALGLADSVGRLTTDMVADIIAVRGNPLKELATLRQVNMVMKAGQLVKHNA